MRVRVISRVFLASRPNSTFKVGSWLCDWEGRDWTILKITPLYELDAVKMWLAPHWR